MLRSRLSATLLALALGLLGPGCVHPRPRRPVERPKAVEAKPDYGRELPPGAHALRRITDPRDLPDLRGAVAGRRAELLAATEGSLRYLAKASSRRFFPVSGIDHAQVVTSLERLKGLLASELSDDDVGVALAAEFDVYTSVGFDDRGGVLFTGYYTPIFEASRTRTPRFRYPIHGLPANHVKDPITGETLGRRRKDGTIDPSYPTRAELVRSGALDGLELAWFERAFEPYIVGVQGSGFLRLQDGTMLEVGYAGTNGKPYASVGQELIRRGAMRKDELSLRKIIEYFEAHPEQLDPITATNERYVFFRESKGGPYGCLSERVQDGVSIATDKAIFPRGAPCFLTATLPDKHGGSRPFGGLVLDQDAGGAIRAPGRCDVYMGVGDEAGERAGRTLSEGRLYYLIAKSGTAATTVPASSRR